MRQIYCDNGSTSFPKAPGMGTVMAHHIETNGFNISRGGYQKAYDLEEDIIETRQQLCDLFDFPKIKNVIFTPGATIGLNMILKGLLKKGDHVITSSMEHNAVVRPLTQLLQDGIQWTEVNCDQTGKLSVKQVGKAIQENTKLVLLVHGSNVCGTVLPIREVGALCEERKVFFAVDAAQTAGTLPISMQRDKIQVLVFPGHKSLLGPQGIGGIILTDEVAAEMMPVISGGTGSLSAEDIMPERLPDKFQAGTLNLPGIIGLHHGLKFIQQEGINAMYKKKRELTSLFIEAILNMNDVRLIGSSQTKNRCPVIALDFYKKDNAEVSYLLESEYGIMTRCGLHCAPHAHKTLNTFPQGVVRFSFGYFNLKTEIADVISAIHKILKA